MGQANAFRIAYTISKEGTSVPSAHMLEVVDLIPLVGNFLEAPSPAVMMTEIAEFD